MPRRLTTIGSPAWSGLLWVMALLGLLLLPTDYRAGAETAHAHALVHLFVDAADGSVRHHHVDASPASQEVATNWFDPAAAAPVESDRGEPGTAQPDVAEQHDSAPVASGIHFLVDTVTVFATLMAGRKTLVLVGRQPASRFPAVLHPPPRWSPAAS